MRFLIIDDDAEYRRALRYHLEVEWPRAAIEEYEPGGAGPLPRAFALVGIDLVLLGLPRARGQALADLTRLRDRPDCPPVILFAEQSDELLAVDALKAGAENFFPKSRVKHRRLIRAIRDALDDGEQAGVPPPAGRNVNGVRRHRFLARLYSGDLSSVYLAESGDSGERMAFKVLRHVRDPDGELLLDRFLREYEIIARVVHPNVVRIFDLGIADDHAYIAMEFLDAGSLAQRLNKALEPALAVDYTRQIGSALAAIHDAGILHRDLKPANIMFREQGSLALIDFGLATEQTLQEAIAGTGRIFGTPHYMSPEQGHAEPTDQRSDIYSLGCVFYEMLTGVRPFTANSPMGVIYAQAHAPRPRLGPEFAGLQPLLDCMIAADPDGRYPSAHDLLRDLDELPA